jgi:hypothetical protein
MPTALSFASALSASAARSFLGVQGHLVTISTAAENAYVTGLLPVTNVWIAADDIAVEGTYRFSAGPAAGTALTYLPWSPGEPNGFNNEDCAMLWDFGVLPNNWADWGCANLAAFMIEYECSTGMELTLAGCQGLPNPSLQT